MNPLFAQEAVGEDESGRAVLLRPPFHEPEYFKERLISRSQVGHVAPSLRLGMCHLSVCLRLDAQDIDCRMVFIGCHFPILLCHVLV